MCWNEWVELICSVLSAVGLIVSAVIVIYYFCKRINVYAFRSNGLIVIYGCALHTQEKAIRLRILTTEKCELDNGLFFASGKVESNINYREYTQLRIFDPKDKNYDKIIVEITLLGGRTLCCKCRVR